MRELDRRLIQITPAPRQLRLQEMEFYAFVHFTVNTFTGREWGVAQNYHMALDSGTLGIEGCVDLIAAAFLREE